MDTMIKRISLLALLICALLPLQGCGKDDEPLEEDSLQSVEITYTFTVSAEMLEYFNITAEYLNPQGEPVGKQMNGPELTIKTSVNKFPAQRPLAFSVTRTEKAAPTETPQWTYGISIVADSHYYPSGNVVTSKHDENMSATPKPDKFNEWTNQFIKKMDTGYAVTINANGTVTY